MWVSTVASPSYDQIDKNDCIFNDHDFRDFLLYLTEISPNMRSDHIRGIGEKAIRVSQHD
jgi:hypothetical protein